MVMFLTQSSNRLLAVTSALRDINLDMAKEREARLQLEEKFEIQEELLTDISRQYLSILSKLENKA